jgi:hypothetical protein
MLASLTRQDFVMRLICINLVLMHSLGTGLLVFG